MVHVAKDTELCRSYTHSYKITEVHIQRKWELIGVKGKAKKYGCYQTPAFVITIVDWYPAVTHTPQKTIMVNTCDTKPTYSFNSRRSFVSRYLTAKNTRPKILCIQLYAYPWKGTIVENRIQRNNLQKEKIFAREMKMPTRSMLQLIKHELHMNAYHQIMGKVMALAFKKN